MSRINQEPRRISRREVLRLGVAVTGGVASGVINPVEVAANMVATGSTGLEKLLSGFTARFRTRTVRADDCAPFERTYPEPRDTNGNGEIDLGDTVATVLQRTVVCGDGSQESTYEDIGSRPIKSAELGQSTQQSVPPQVEQTGQTAEQQQVNFFTLKHPQGSTRPDGLIVSAPGVPASIEGTGLDRANHDVFTSPLQMEEGDENVMNLWLGEPGCFLADRDLIARNEPQNLPIWDERVAKGEAEYIRGQGSPDRNFWTLDNPNDLMLVNDPEHPGQKKFQTMVGRGKIIRIDAEEGWFRVNGQLIDLYQLGTAGRQGHYTLFIETPENEDVNFEALMPTVPGTQIQVLGNNCAFFSVNAFMQGVTDRLARPDYPRYVVFGYDMNTKAFAVAELDGVNDRSWNVLGANFPHKQS